MQNLFENNFVAYNNNNEFGVTFVENWTRSLNDLPKVKFVAKCVFSRAAYLERNKFEHHTKPCECDNCGPQTCDCLKVSYICILCNFYLFKILDTS